MSSGEVTHGRTGRRRGGGQGAGWGLGDCEKDWEGRVGRSGWGERKCGCSNNTFRCARASRNELADGSLRNCLNDDMNSNRGVGGVTVRSAKRSSPRSSVHVARYAGRDVRNRSRTQSGRLLYRISFRQRNFGPQPFPASHSGPTGLKGEVTGRRFSGVLILRVQPRVS